MATVSQWVGGARPRTLPAAIAPVAVGSGVAAYALSFNVFRAALALIVAMALQVGVNYANDYSDGIRGTDKSRVGPVRLVGQELAKPSHVKTAALLSFLVAAVAGLVLIALSGLWWLIIAGVACIAAAWLYTGGPRPYGYLGLGEIFVFIFFGLVPVMGTTYTQIAGKDVAAGTMTLSFIGSVGVGAVACAILVANNLRDIPTDIHAGKHTLAVRLGDRKTRIFYVILMVSALVVVPLVAMRSGPWVNVSLISALLGWRPVRRVATGVVGRGLVPVLKDTGTTLLVYGVLLGAGLALSSG